jgi:hypothetical protein
VKCPTAATDQGKGYNRAHSAAVRRGSLKPAKRRRTYLPKLSPATCPESQRTQTSRNLRKPWLDDGHDLASLVCAAGTERE